VRKIGIVRVVFVVAVAALGLAGPLAPASADGYGPGSVLFSFRDARITESSGVVASSLRDGVFFTHNDSGDSARFFAVDEQGCTLSTFNLAGVTAVDIEDIARSDDDLWLADIGDNNYARPNVVVHRVAEPPMDNSATNRSSTGCRAADEVSVAAESFTLQYPDHAQDAETLLADPANGQLFIVTKTPLGASFVYAAPEHLRSDVVNVLTPVGAIAFPPSTTYDRPLVPSSPGTQQAFDLAGRQLAVGGDVAPARDRVVVRTYTDAWEWKVAPGQALADAFRAVPAQLPLVYERQGEAIAYTRDGSSLLTTCEDAGCAAHLYRGA
jgi:hypothetical protein